MTRAFSMGRRALFVTAFVISTPAVAVQLQQISGLSPNPVGSDPNPALAATECNGAPQTGVVYRNSEVEPHLAVNPTNGANMIAGWHQDRWSTGGAQSLGAAYTLDGGANWIEVILPFTRCAGGAGTDAGDFERASDPWITFSPDGTAHYMALVFKDTVSANGMAVATSQDGGASWSDPVLIWDSPAQDAGGNSLFHDKNTMTADPLDPRVVHATWTVFRSGNTAVLYSRSDDGGQTWGPPKPVGGARTVDPANLLFFRQGAQILVLPNGDLRNFFYRILFDRATFAVTYEQATFGSSNGGRTWKKLDDTVSDFAPQFAFDFELRIPVRDAGPIPDVAVNSSNGDLYLTWQDDNGEGVSGVALSRSTDGGSTWSEPILVSPGPSITTSTPTPAEIAQAFLPSVAVNESGQVGVQFYDFRNDQFGDATLDTDVWVRIYSADLVYQGEQRVAPAPMDLRQAPLTGTRGYFPGDYVGFSNDGDDFVSAFTWMNNLGLPVDTNQNNSGVAVDANDRTNIWFARITP